MKKHKLCMINMFLVLCIKDQCALVKCLFEIHWFYIESLLKPYHSLFHQIHLHIHRFDYILYWDPGNDHCYIGTDLVHIFQNLPNNTKVLYLCRSNLKQAPVQNTHAHVIFAMKQDHCRGMISRRTTSKSRRTTYLTKLL